MKKIFFCGLASLLVWTAGAQSDEWQDATVNAVNRLPMHASYFAFETPEAARTGDMILRPVFSDRFISKRLCHGDASENDTHKTVPPFPCFEILHFIV